MSYEDYCAACTYLGESCTYDGKYYCERKGEDVYASDARCYNFCEAYSRSNSSRENMFGNSQSHAGTGCYLTTIMCQILGYKNDNYYLNTLRNFRNNYLQKDPKYLNILLSYDFIGPQIAASLSNDKSNLIIATSIFNNYIKKSVSLIEENKYEEAINIYKEMTIELAKKYHIPVIIPKLNPSKLEEAKLAITKMGHGKKRSLSAIVVDYK